MFALHFKFEPFTVFYSLSIFCWSFLNFNSALKFCVTKKFKDFFRLKLKNKQIKENFKK